MSEILFLIDNVNHPQHYNTGNIECIDGIIASIGIDAAIDFCEVNVLKYAWRAKHNGKEMEDMKKGCMVRSKGSRIDRAERRQQWLKQYFWQHL